MMKPIKLFLSGLIGLSLLSCNQHKAEIEPWAKQAVATATMQMRTLATTYEETGQIPRSLRSDGTVWMSDAYAWTSGFFPGCLWLTHELSGDTLLQNQASYYTSLIHPISKYKNSHDVGFMMMCSYGQQYRIAPTDSIPALLVQAADNLIGRYNPTIQAIRSWNHEPWNYPVIIDNMMNLNLLYWASRYTEQDKYKEIAIQHTKTTLRDHFRADMSSYHVVDYDLDGSILAKKTHQGVADESNWARGQAWALYGFTEAYRETQELQFLEAAVQIARLIQQEENLPADHIPYWDYDDPKIPDAPRDASAAAVTASALFELSQYVADGQKYYQEALFLLKQLSSPAYLAEPGSNQGFLIKHATGNLPAGYEIDTSITYADYYYLEALKRYLDLEGITYPIQ